MREAPVVPCCRFTGRSCTVTAPMRERAENPRTVVCVYHWCSVPGVTLAAGAGARRARSSRRCSRTKGEVRLADSAAPESMMSRPGSRPRRPPRRRRARAGGLLDDERHPGAPGDPGVAAGCIEVEDVAVVVHDQRETIDEIHAQQSAHRHAVELLEPRDIEHAGALAEQRDASDLQSWHAREPESGAAAAAAGRGRAETCEAHLGEAGLVDDVVLGAAVHQEPQRRGAVDATLDHDVVVVEVEGMPSARSPFAKRTSLSPSAGRANAGMAEAASGSARVIHVVSSLPSRSTSRIVNGIATPATARQSRNSMTTGSS